MHILDQVDAASLKQDIPAFRAGDTVKVHVNIIEGNRSRIQVFQVVTRGDVRRAKLYYLRELRGKKAKIKEKREN